MGLINEARLRIRANGKFFDLTLIGLLGLLSFTWVKADLIISGGDFPFNFNPLRNFERYHSTWYDGVSTGLLNVQAIPQMVTFQSFLALSEMLGLPLFVAQRLMFYFLFTMGGLSMYFLTTTIVKGRESRVAGLASAFFYMLNPFTMIIMWAIPAVLLFFYPVVPLILALYIRGLDSRKTVFHVFLLCFFSSIVFSAAYTVGTFAITTWILLLSYLAFYLARHRNDRLKISHALKFTALLLMSWAAFNAYWLLPYIHTLSSLSTTAVYQDSVDILRGTSSEAGLVNTFRLFGYPVFDKIFMGNDLFYPYSPIYSTYKFIIISFIVPILAFLTLLVEKKEKFYILYFSTFSLAVLFFFKGAQPPFGGLYVWLVKHVSLMVAFRNPLDKFGSLLPLGYSFLLGCTLAKLYHLPHDLPKFRRPIRFSFFVLSTLIFVVLVFPFWTGQAFEKGGEIRPSWQVKVPDYYGDAASWLAQQEETFRVYPIPLMNLFGTPFNWEHGHGGADPRQFIFDKAIVDDGNDLAKLASSYLTQQLINPPDGKSVARILGLLNVRYVLVSDDIKESYFNVDKPSLLRSKTALKNEEFDGIRLKKSFNKLHFYEVSGEYHLPKIYSPTTLTSVIISNFTYGVNSQLISATVPTALSSNDYDTRNAIFILNFDPFLTSLFDRYKTNESTTVTQKGSILKIRTAADFPTPPLEFKRISPTKYRVVVRDFDKPFPLVFSENFNEGWKAYVRPFSGQKNSQTTESVGGYFKGIIENRNLDDGFFCETCLLTPISEDYHYWVNGYANSWWVVGPGSTDAQEHPYKGDLEVIIEFWPQKLFYLGLIISTFTFLSYILYLSTKYLAARRKGLHDRP